MLSKGRRDVDTVFTLKDGVCLLPLCHRLLRISMTDED